MLIFIHVTYNTDNIIGFMAFKTFILATLPAGRSQPTMYRGRFVIECGRAKSGRFLDPLVQAELTVPAQEFVYIPHLRNLYFRICRTFTFACMDSIRNNFRCVLFILFRMVFVAYKRPPWAPKGPKGPEGPLGPKPLPQALGPFIGALGPSRFARNRKS